MKKIVFISLVLWLIVAACSRKGNNYPEGTWKMVRMQMIEG